MPNLTKHGKKRITERVGISSGDAKRNARRAYRHGIHHSETSGELCAWLNSRYFKYKTGSHMRVFRGFLYIFHNDVLITVYAIPKELQVTLEKCVDPDAYERYVDYISGKEIERKIRNKARKAEKYQEKLTAFRNLIMLNDIREYSDGRFKVNITGVSTDQRNIVIRYIPKKMEIPDLRGLADYIKDRTEYKVVRFVHVKDQYGRPIFPEKYTVKPEEDELVYHVE